MEPILEILKQNPMMMQVLEDMVASNFSRADFERYEARRKAQLDTNTGMKVARLEGREKGREEGEKVGLEKGAKVGTIHLCERLLDRPETPTERLIVQPLEDLTRLADELQRHWLKKE